MFRPLDRTPGGFSASSSKVKNASLVHEYYVLKSGYDENRFTKQNNSTTLMNTDRKGKLLNKTTAYKDTLLHNLSNRPKEFIWAACTRDGQK